MGPGPTLPTYVAVCSRVKKSLEVDSRPALPKPNAGAVSRADRICDPNMLFPSDTASILPVYLLVVVALGCCCCGVCCLLPTNPPQIGCFFACHTFFFRKRLRSHPPSRLRGHRHVILTDGGIDASFVSARALLLCAEVGSEASVRRIHVLLLGKWILLLGHVFSVFDGRNFFPSKKLGCQKVCR